MGAMWYVTGHSSKEVPMAVVAETKPFVVWMGWLRLFALLLVCVCHACDPLSAFGTGAEKTWIAWIGSAARPCVPLFVMLTGALLLPVNEGFGGMCRRRVSRLVWPFLLWTAVYAALPWLLATCGVAVEMIQRVFFPFAAPLHTDASSIARTFFLSLFQFNQYAVQLWYIYLLVGLYLFMPILSPWLRTATLRAKVAFLGLWGATLALHYWPLLLEALLGTSWGATFFADYATRFLGGSTVNLAATTSWDAFPLLGQCDWNTFGGLYMFAGFVGYLVLGHVLREVRLSLGRTLAIGVPLVIVGYAIVALGTHWMWARPGCTAKMFEYFWWYCSIPVAMMSAGVFLLVKQLNWAPRPVLFLLKDLTKCGLGVFCAHYVFVTGTYYLLNGLLPIPLLVACSAVIGLAVAWTLVSLLERIHPLARRLLG